MPARVLIYGCYGYTGELIVEEAQMMELPVLLSGRNADLLSAAESETKRLQTIGDLSGGADSYARSRRHRATRSRK